MLIFLLLVINSLVKSIITLLLEGFASPVTLISNSIFDPKISLLSNSIEDEGVLGLFVVNPGGRISLQ